jgi:membrane-bound lytic murein transglycosylase D
MRAIFRDAGLPEDLVYIPLIESGFESTAYSRARALGLWQFVPNTARIYDLEISDWVDERLDPIASTHAAADYLGDLHREFRDWYLTFAAYNAGPGRVHGAIRTAGSRDYWTITERRALPRESRDYVPKLIAVALIAKQSEQYGISRLYKPIVTFDIAYVPDATSLDVVAEAAEVPLDDILALNLHLVRGVTPPGLRYAVRIPAGTPRIFAENYAALPPSDRVRSVMHIVRRGETLGRIARTYGVSLSDISAANDDLEPKELRAGQRLLIPGVRNLPGLAD